MKMKGKSKLILLFAGLASLFLLGGCSFSDSLEDILNDNNLTAKVTYYSNGGKFEGNSDTKDMYYKSGSQALNIGKINPTNGTASIEKGGYDFAGWYYAVDEDGDGIPDTEGDTNTYKLGDAVNFSQKLTAGEHWLLVAKWDVQIRVRIKLVCDTDAEIQKKTKGDEKVTYKNGDEVAAYQFESGTNSLDLDSKAPFEAEQKSYTFLEYYTDPACLPEHLHSGVLYKQETDTVLYAKYIEGDWTIVKDAADAFDMFSNSLEGERYWLFNDIDMVEQDALPPINTFGCEIQGNGYKIGNLKIKADSLTTSQKVSMFGEMQSSAIIKNLTIENVAIVYTVRFGGPGTLIHFVFTSLAAEAQIDNVKISGEMTISKPATEQIENFGNPPYTYMNCLYGGYATDEEYTSNNANGFSVNNGADPNTYITIN